MIAARLRRSRVVLQCLRCGAVLAVRVLTAGGVAAELDGRAVPIGSAKQRLVLALLAANPQGVSRGRLVDALWGDEPPPSAESTVMA